jgi:hypothetical protein
MTPQELNAVVDHFWLPNILMRWLGGSKVATFFALLIVELVGVAAFISFTILIFG